MHGMKGHFGLLAGKAAILWMNLGRDVLLVGAHSNEHVSTSSLQVRELRLVRREGGGSTLCSVLVRFEDQAAADDFYTHYNGKPVRETSFFSG